MRRRNIQLFLLLGVLAMTSLFSCGVDRWPEYYKWTGRDLWIDSIMREEYLWFEDIPAAKELNYFLDPAAFLDKIKSPLDKGYSSVDTLYPLLRQAMASTIPCIALLIMTLLIMH